MSNSDLQSRIKQLERDLAAAREALRVADEREATYIAGLFCVGDLINESRGVEGLHMNGDLAMWDELRSGGRFETWLAEYDAAQTLAMSRDEALAAAPAEPKGDGGHTA